MASSSRTLVAAHTSTITANDLQTFTLESTRSEAPRHIESDILPEHATETSVLYDPQAHILLRVIHHRRTVELISLSTDVSPIRFTFPAPVLPSPAVVYDDGEIHVIACTQAGSVFRLVFPLPHLWNTQYMAKDWREEYFLRHPTSNLLGPVHVKEAGCLFIALKDGGILQLDASRRLGNAEFQEWHETILRPPVSLSLSSFIPFTTKPQPGATNTVAFATAPSPSPSLVAFSLQRDRVIRVWEAGSCVATAHVPPAFSNSLIRGASVPPPTRSVPILDEEPQHLMHVIPPPEGSSLDEGIRLAVYMPSSTGGYFSIFVLSARNSSGARALEFYGHKLASEHPRVRSLRDFLVVDETLWVLWDDEGNTSVESTSVDFDDEDLEETSSPWVPLVPAHRIDPLPSLLDDQQLPTHGSFTGAFMSFLLRPGAFSKYTLRAALQNYTTAFLSTPGPHKAIFSRRYNSLSEHIAAVVGCTVNLNIDPQTGEQQWNSYWAALRRDWEGFIARCVNIERNARWPLKLGRSAYPGGDPLVLERERLCAVVFTDEAIRFHEREVVTRGVGELTPLATKSDASMELTRPVMELARTLRASINGLQLAKVDASLLGVSRSDLKSSFLDIAADLARRDIISGVSEELASYLDAQLDAIPRLDEALHEILNTVEDLDGVKLEVSDDGEEEAGEPQLEWQRALTTAYVATSIHARYDTLLTVLTLVCFIAEWRPDTFTEYAGIIGGGFSALQCVSTLHSISRRPAGDPENRTPIRAEDDVAELLQTMRVSGANGNVAAAKRFLPTHSLLHLLYAASEPASKSFDVAPGAAAHQYLSYTDMLNCGESPGARLAEAKLIHQLWQLGHPDAAREMADWYPRTPAIAYVLGRSLLELGRVDDATAMLERVEGFIGREHSDQGEDIVSLTAVLPQDVDIDSPASYYRHLVTLFDKTQNAAEMIYFARLAIAHSDPIDTQDLWFKSHKAHLDLGLYEDAYMVMAATPFPELQSELTRNLVNSMCDNDEIDRLVSLNFIGYQSDVEESLSFKARNADPRQKPHYSEVLHAWYVFRGDFRSAAAAMYQHGQRLADLVDVRAPDFLDVMTLQAKSYLAAINALSLVDQRNAWVQYVLPTGEGSRRRHHHQQHIPEQHFQTASLDIDVITLSEMKQEYALILATLQLFTEPAVDISDITAYPLSDEEIVTRFLSAGMVDAAISTSRSLKIDMAIIFSTLTTQCMRLSQIADDEVDPADVPWLLTDQVSSWEGSNIQRAWRLLRTALERHDNLDNDWAYRKSVFTRILDLDRLSRVPAWLIKFFEDEQPEYLIRTSLKYGLVEQALQFCLSMVRKANQTLLRGPPAQASATWLPYTLIDQVIMAAVEERKVRYSQSQNELAQQLRDEIAARTKRLAKWKVNTA